MGSEKSAARIAAIKKSFILALRTAKNLFLVPKCISCRKRLSPIPDEKVTHGKIVLCPKCEKEWMLERARMCKGCGKTADACTCFNSYFKQEQDTVPSIVFYTKEDSTVAQRAVLYIKRRKNKPFFGFLAKELSTPLGELLRKKGFTAGECVFTFVPRKARSLAEAGFDQAEKLCRALSEEMGAEMLPLITRLGGKKQKKLDTAKRDKNAKDALAPNTALLHFPKKYKGKTLREAVGDRPVVIIDDVITTGATLKSSAELLRKSLKCPVVTVATVAKTPLQKRAHLTDRARKAAPSDSKT